MKGGARSRSGPSRDPNALRRERDGASDEWLSLPAHGRRGAVPRWPLKPPASAREADMWAGLWRMPQAAAWEAHHQHIYVALYVRNLVAVEEPDAPVTLTAEVRRMMEGLGLTQRGMKANRWRLASGNA